MHRHFLPVRHGLPDGEVLRLCAGLLPGVGAAALAGWLAGPGDQLLPLVVAPIGASAAMVFALPASPLAQPFPLLAGNTASALIGVAAGRWLPGPALPGIVAVAAALAAMALLHCLHPPGAAVALLAATGGKAVEARGFRFVLEPVLLESAVVLATAIAYHTLTGHRYPQHPHHPSRAVPPAL